VKGKFIRLGLLAKNIFKSRLSFQNITVAAIIITRGQQVSGLQLDIWILSGPERLEGKSVEGNDTE
jgi:hypothetical protein